MELFCAAGQVQLNDPGTCLVGDTTRMLVTGQGWRAGDARYVLLSALSPARLLVCPEPVPKVKSRDAALVVRNWLLAALRLVLTRP